MKYIICETVLKGFSCDYITYYYSDGTFEEIEKRPGSYNYLRVFPIPPKWF